ncbi:Kelch repeat-containing protein [Hyphobacterium sp.]|uniref:Kelch repeat-containing protein n=1 Tax=Hyphobacterium sp. TaxID=2004662 RepID=UPI003BAA2619
MTSRRLVIIAAILLLTGCSSDDVVPSSGEIAQLPHPVSNNAVAGVEVDGRFMAYSFAGLLAGKTWEDVTANAYACDLAAGDCRSIAPLPDRVGRLASIAATVGDQIYIFGGYTVAADNSERSTPEAWRFDPVNEEYARLADIRVPVDDSVALVYQERYVYLVSGWHDHDNVANVQVYDVAENEWFDATDWPGSPVFGHAAGVIGNVMLVCGGVEVVPPAAEGARRTFELYDACWRGEINPGNLAEIDWTQVELEGGPRYRAAMVGSQRLDRFMILGGTDNPYNYNGVGYNGVPSEPDPSILQIDADGTEAVQSDTEVRAMMDHRGLIEWNNGFVTLGGMEAGQEVSAAVIYSRFED